VWSADGNVVIRNVTAAEVSATYMPSLTAEDVVDRVAQEHHVDADNYRVVAHFSISGPAT
jgi:hypothetical protein